MHSTRRYLPKVECLEDRLALNADFPDVVDAGTDDAQVVEIIDPTADPVDPSNMTISATVTGLGPTVNGQVQSITVTGIAPGSMDFADFQVQVGDALYTIDFVTANFDGSYTLTAANGFDPASLSVGMTITIISGSGSDFVSPTNDAWSRDIQIQPIFDVPLIDPTMDPVG